MIRATLLLAAAAFLMPAAHAQNTGSLLTRS